MTDFFIYCKYCKNETEHIKEVMQNKGRYICTKCGEYGPYTNVKKMLTKEEILKEADNHCAGRSAPKSFYGKVKC